MASRQVDDDNLNCIQTRVWFHSEGFYGKGHFVYRRAIPTNKCAIEEERINIVCGDMYCACYTAGACMYGEGLFKRDGRISIHRFHWCQQLRFPDPVRICNTGPCAANAESARVDEFAPRVPVCEDSVALRTEGVGPLHFRAAHTVMALTLPSARTCATVVIAILNRAIEPNGMSERIISSFAPVSVANSPTYMYAPG